MWSDKNEFILHNQLLGIMTWHTCMSFPPALTVKWPPSSPLHSSITLTTISYLASHQWHAQQQWDIESFLGCTEGREIWPGYEMQVNMHMSACRNLSVQVCKLGNIFHKVKQWHVLQFMLVDIYSSGSIPKTARAARLVPRTGEHNVIPLTYSTYLVTAHPYTNVLCCVCLDTKLSTRPDGRLLQTMDILFHSQL